MQMRPLFLVSCIMGMLCANLLHAQVINIHTPDRRQFREVGFVIRQTSPFDWVQVESHAKPLPVSAEKIAIALSQNEYEHAGIIASTHNVYGYLNLEVEVPGVTDRDADAVRFREVRTLTPMWEVNYYSYSNWGRVAMPELLKPFRGPRYMLSSEQVHIWITVNARNLVPGTYTGNVTGTLVNSLTYYNPRGPLPDSVVSIPFEIKVFPIELPLKSHLITTNWKYVPGPRELAEPYARALQQYYLNQATLEPPDVNDDLSLNLERWDWINRAEIMAKYGIRPSIVGVYPFNVDYEWYNKIQKMLGSKQQVPPPKIFHEDDMVQYFKDVSTVLKKYGHTSIAVSPYDEPKARKMHDMVRSHKLAKAGDPDYKIMVGYNEGLLAGENGMDALKLIAPWSDDWCSTRSGQVSDVWAVDRKIIGNYARYRFYLDLQNKGHTIWYYHNSWRACDRPGVTLGWCRADGYYIWKYGLDGYPTSEGTYGVPHADVVYRGARKPFLVPAECQDMTHHLFPEKNEDGSFSVYACKRLEAFRGGITDHFYLLILEQLTQKALVSDDPVVNKLGQRGMVTLSQCYESIRNNLNHWENYCRQKRYMAEMIIALQEAGLKVEMKNGMLSNQHDLQFEQYVHTPDEKQLKQVIFTDNLFQDASFERSENLAVEWQVNALVQAGMMEDVQGDIRKDVSPYVRVYGNYYRTGNKSLMLRSPGPEEYKAGWVNTEIRSMPLEVKEGDILKAAVAVRIPENISNTSRGAIVNILGYTQTGKEIASWAPGMVEFHTVQKTIGWEELELVVKVEDPRMKFARIRLGLAGEGECYFDDINFQRGQ